MSLNNLVLLCNLYTVLVIKKNTLFHRKGVSVWWNVIFFWQHDVQFIMNERWSHRVYTQPSTYILTPSWVKLEHALLSDRRRSSSRKEERFLLPLPYFSFKKTNTGSWSSLRWDRFGLSDFASWLATNINMHVSRQRAWGEGVLCLIITIGS